MSLIEFIGFIISMVTLIFLFFKKVREERYRRAHPEEYEAEKEEQEERLKNFLKSLDVDMEKSEREEKKRQLEPKRMPPEPLKKSPSSSYTPQKHKVPPSPKTTVNDDYKIKTSVEQRRYDNTIEKGAIKSEDRYQDPFGARVVSVDLSKPQEADAYMVIKSQRNSSGQKIQTDLKTFKKMIIYKEIIGTPKGLEKDFQPYKR